MLLGFWCVADNIKSGDRKFFSKFFKFAYIGFKGFIFHLKGNLIIEDKIDLSRISLVVIRVSAPPTPYYASRFLSINCGSKFLI